MTEDVQFIERLDRVYKQHDLVKEAFNLYRTALDESRKVALAVGAHALVDQIDKALSFGETLKR